MIKVVNKSKYNLPTYAKDLDSGMDVRANIEDPIILKPLERALVPTGLFFELPDNLEIQVRPRSGLAAKHGITVLNSPGTIDSGYKDEIKIILINLSNEPFTINPGDRIAQFVISEIKDVTVLEATEIDETDNRGGGFGHSGIEKLWNYLAG